ncbi:MAG: aldose 1-epimerase family protein [Eubacteriales bacterium]|nr:aldose 1-epimerase family protein [Eubacteriales bacterium]
MMNSTDLRKKAGHPDQLAQIQTMRVEGGAADGQSVCLVENGALSFFVSVSRGMDINSLRFRGVNLCHITKPGWLANNTELENFIPCGMFFTCGLKNVGPQTPGEPAHGRQRFLPAANLSRFAGFEGDVFKLRLCGEVREAGLFSKNLLRRRTIETELESRRIVIRDTIVNQGFSDEAFMLLYHFNLGFPLLDEGTELVAPSRAQRPRDAASAAAKGDSDLFRMDAPRDCYPEQVFYHDLAADREGNTFCALKNDRLGLALKLSFKKNELPFFTQWKSIASGDYVMGLEPGNCHVEGMEREREMGSLAVLKAGESRDFTVTLDVLSGGEELAALCAERENV